VAHIEIHPQTCTTDYRLHALVVELVVELSPRYAITCNGPLVGCECPSDLKSGDTWESVGPAVQDALRHIHLHETKG
jgi:hypothetical protein